ncbi:peptidyl-prolyl cis-trans isomerase [Nocardioides carbamazepini]|uniref:peptidylprolyl isomerase n=1 Tax=Nocardioides carbamazepini TaxID=2854259 RepID=UPI00214A01F5|nr:peptidyl-prolyl cis-trans isomerase [Nocardioides carbamazepini]MCR1785754.1 peptidyl-prolyl cis-trans isomerase [Nocardioides carbamazepini]
MRWGQRRIQVGAVLAVALGMLVVAPGWRPWSDELPDDAAFAIGERVVTVAELDARNDSLRALYGVEEPGGGADQASFRRQAAKSMAISIVLDRAVDDAGIEVSDTTVDQTLSGFIEQRFQGDRTAFVSSLGNVNTSERVVRDEVRRQIALRELLAAIAGEVTVSKAELRAAFEQRRDQLGTPERRRVRNIVVADEQAAREIRTRLDAGADPARVARRASIDGATRDAGGDLGAVARADLLPEVGAAVFGTPAGAAYGPVQGSQGWNVGVVVEVLPAVPATFAAVRADLRRQLTGERTEARWSDWLAGRIRAADIRYREPYRPRDPYDVTAWNQPATGTEPQP